MKIFFCFIPLLFISQVNLKLSDKERKELFDKYVKELSLDNIDNLFFEEEEDEKEKDLKKIKYDKAMIDEIIKKNDFPSSYNFIEDSGAPVNIKNQGQCGCCWAMAALTALSYRYFKKGYTLDFSTQHELSCYLKTCLKGNNLVDPYLSLLINGTLTEECFPFTSGERKIEECPSQCKDPNVEYKKYYAKNAYSVKINRENFYNVTALIIDQLITNGPVMTSIEIYDDLYELASNKDCQNIIYNYDGKSKSEGGHALTIVGYGYMNDKYYWLVQNSWGEDACGNGFMKIEFGQVGIGSISFAEPWIEREESSEVIEVSYNNLDDYCDLKIESGSNLDNWKNELIVVYEHEKYKKEFKYFCGVTKASSKDEKKIYCYYENLNTEFYKGVFKYKTFRSTGKINNFVLDDSFHDTQFLFQGNDKILPICSLYLGITNLYHYISENSRKFFFLYKQIGFDQVLPAIYPNEKYQNISLSNCVKTNITNKGNFIGYCDITDEEMEFFDKCTTSGGERILSHGLCDIKYYRNIIVCRMDEKTYPIFRVNSFEIVERSSFIITLTLNTSIEGNLDGYAGTNNLILGFVNIEDGTNNIVDTINCRIGIPKKQEKNYGINCSLYLEKSKHFDNIYLYPYYGIVFVDSPFEIIIEDVMKGNNHLNSKPEL